MKAYKESLETLSEIEYLRSIYHTVRTKLKELERPKITDLGKVSDIYRIYLRRCESRRPKEPSDRKVFMMVAILLLSPTTLLGQRMRAGLRLKFAEVLNLHSPTPLSRDCSQLMTCYNIYRDFREEVNALLEAVISELNLG